MKRNRVVIFIVSNEARVYFFTEIFKKVFHP